MAAADLGHQMTDQALAKLEKKITSEYKTAIEEMQEKLLKMNQDSQWTKAYTSFKNGEITQEEYQNWFNRQKAAQKQLQAMQETLAKDMHNANLIAHKIAKDGMADVYALNANYATYMIEQQGQIDTGFTLYNHDTAAALLKEKKQLMPGPSTKKAAQIAANKDMQWNYGKIQSACLQTVLQGESPYQLAGRLQSIATMNENAAIRYARTMTTSVQNSGRYDAFTRAKKLGVNLTCEWNAILDNATRHDHRMLHGQRRPVGEPFEVDGIKIYYPAQSEGPGASDIPQKMIWNCRCTIIAWVAGFEGETVKYNEAMGDMSFDEWQQEKNSPTRKMAEEERQHIVAEGSDITSTWKRRPDQFDFEIEDIINAQGFDGLPQVVSGEEFEAAVRAANGGEGFIAQRTYSAPDQETLDAYRDQLYNGKWYVDCSTGGAQYGRGMYCAADYSGRLTDGIQEEMQHYISVNAGKGSEFAYIETMTLDPSAKVILHKDVGPAFRKAMRGNLSEIASENRLSKAWVTKMQDAYDKADEVERLRRKGMTIADSSYKKALNAVKRAEDSAAALAERAGMRFVDATRISDAYWNDARNDYGAMAAQMGYDAINAVGHGESGSYTVILNRTKVIIRRP